MASTETFLVGMLLREPASLDRVLKMGLSSRHFRDEQCAAIFGEIQHLAFKGSNIDPSAIALKLGGDYPVIVTDLLEAAPWAQNPEFYAGGVLNGAWKRDASQSLSEIVAQLRQISDVDSEGMEQLKELTYSKLSELTETSQSIATFEPTELADAFLKEVEQAVEMSREGKTPGITTGFKQLDDITGGWMPATFNVLGARTSDGKTTLGANFTVYAAQAGAKVAYFTIEMRATRIYAKFVSRLASIIGNKLSSGRVTDDEIDRLHHWMPHLIDMGIRVNDKAGRSIETIEAEAWRLRRSGKLDLLIVDYVQQLHCTTKRFSSRQQELTYITGRLQELAKGLNIPIIVLAQLNREAENLPPGEHPRKAHLKDSGSLEQDADTIILIYRENREDPCGPTWLILDKYRDGQLGPIPVDVDFRVNKFANPRR